MLACCLKVPCWFSWMRTEATDIKRDWLPWFSRYSSKSSCHKQICILLFLLCFWAVARKFLFRTGCEIFRSFQQPHQNSWAPRLPCLFVAIVCVIDVILYPFAQYKLAISWKYCGEHSLIQKQYWYKEQADYSETQKRQRDSWKNSKVNTRLDKGR